jgi:hypothetical protein
LCSCPAVDSSDEGEPYPIVFRNECQIILGPWSQDDSIKVIACEVVFQETFIHHQLLHSKDFLYLPSMLDPLFRPHLEEARGLTLNTSLRCSASVSVPVTGVEPAKNHLVIVLMESMVGFSINRGRLIAILKYKKSFTMIRSGAAIPGRRQCSWVAFSSGTGSLAGSVSSHMSAMCYRVVRVSTLLAILAIRKEGRVVVLTSHDIPI